MKISNIEHINRTKFYGINLEYKGKTYEIYVQELYHKDKNWQKDIVIMAESNIEKESFFPEIEKYILDNIDKILSKGIN
jgi:hypothetical protein